MGKQSKLNFRPFSKWLIWLLLVPSLVLNFYLFQENKKLGQSIKVLAVLDGDTIVLDGKVRLRLRHVDAPELRYCGGKQAKEVLENLVKDRKVVLKEYILDQHGRPMALIYQGEIFVNREMLKSGWVRYHHDRTSVSEDLKKIAEQVKQEKKGIYSSLCRQTENPDNPDCLIKGNIDKNKYQDNRKYYFPGCAQYEFTIVEKDLGEDWFCSEEEARRAGFEKAKSCYNRSY